MKTWYFTITFRRKTLQKNVSGTLVCEGNPEQHFEIVETRLREEVDGWYYFAATYMVISNNSQMN